MLIVTRMLRLTAPLARSAVLTTILAIATASCGTTTTSCEEMACTDQLIVELQPLSGQFTLGAYSVFANTPYGTRSCQATVTAGSLGVGTCDVADTMLQGSLRCSGSGCDPAKMVTTQVYQLVLPGTPTSASVSVDRDGARISDGAFSPSYESCGCEPNGSTGFAALVVE